MKDYQGLLAPGLPLAPMSEQETETFLLCALMERHAQTQEAIIEQVCGSSEVPFVLKVMRARLQQFWDRVSPSLVLYLAGVCDNVSQAVLWAHALALLAKRNPRKVVGFDIWATSFGEGLPTPEAYKKAWAAQKGSFDNNIVVPGAPVDNYLDTPEAWSVV